MTPKPTSARRCPVDVFRYHDYRVFLSDVYAAKKKRGYSYRAFSMAAGLGAPNYLKLVITGRRNLSDEMAARFAATCGLGREATDYFLLLVQFNQTPSSEERAALYQRLSAFQRYRKVHKLELADAAYHSNWYLPAIRELVLSKTFREDPEWIGSVLVPPVKASEVERAIQTLLELGLLMRNAEGQLCQQDRVVSTGPQTSGVHIRNYHGEMLERAFASMALIPASDRDISSLTMCLGPAALQHVKARLAQLRRELIEMCVTEINPSQVLQLNLQLFPLSQSTAAPTSSISTATPSASSASAAPPPSSDPSASQRSRRCQ